MDEREIRLLADKLRNDEISTDTFVKSLKGLPFRDLGEVKLDTHRALRGAFPEIVYCPGKSPEQLKRIAETRDSYRAGRSTRLEDVECE